MDIEKLIELNNEKLEEARKEGNEEKIIIHEKIDSIFKSDPAAFFRIDMESALKMLVQIMPEEEVKEAYTSLISPENFEKLRRKFKI